MLSLEEEGSFYDVLFFLATYVPKLGPVLETQHFMLVWGFHGRAVSEHSPHVQVGYVYCRPVGQEGGAFLLDIR